MPIINHRDFEEYVTQEMNFAGPGASVGRRETLFSTLDMNSLGRLPDEWRERLITDIRIAGIRYLVTSYSTPIAWIRGDGVKVIPSARYSVITTRLQNAVRRAWPGAVDSPTGDGI